MNFTEQEPDAGAFIVNPEKGYERLHVSEKTPEALCANDCGTMTRWQNLAFEAPACSHECVDQLWKIYLERLVASLVVEQQLETLGFTPEEAVELVVNEDVEEGIKIPGVIVEEKEVTIH